MAHDTEISYMMSEESLTMILHALRIGREAMDEVQASADQGPGWDDMDRASHDHEVKILDGEIEYLEDILGDES